MNLLRLALHCMLCIESKALIHKSIIQVASAQPRMIRPKPFANASKYSFMVMIYLSHPQLC